jgi:uncharacterized protein (TIGR03435 family)
MQASQTEESPKGNSVTPGINRINIRTLQIILVAGRLMQTAPCQTGPPSPPADRQPPSYEVATIKPSNPAESGSPLRMYIMAAFGMQPQSTQQLIGPEWIDKKWYDIEGKVPESLQEAMNKMTRDERVEQIRLMEQSLLADRFKLKYHFETREMQVYKLVLAKSGLKLKEHPDRTHVGVRFGGNGGTNVMKGAATIPDLAGLLGNVQELNGKPIINETGLSGTFYDFSLRYSNSDAADGADNSAPSSGADAPSIFSAVEEQLGLKLVAAKAPAKVIVIDHIEPPTPN